MAIIDLGTGEVERTQAASQQGRIINLDSGEFVDDNVNNITDSSIPDDTSRVEEPGIFQRAKQFVTGSDRTTPEIEGLDEIGSAPELNEFSLSALKTSFGLLATGDEDKLKKLIKTQIPAAEFREDSKGNTIVDLESGSFALNKPGASPQDFAKLAFDIAAFSPAGKLAQAPKSIAARLGVGGVGAGATEATIQSGVEELGGGEVSTGDVLLSGALGGAGQAAGEALGAGGRLLKGRRSDAAQQVIEAGKREGVPVLTTDVIPPKGIIGGLARQSGERIPIAGTSGVRASQQGTREAAAVDFANSIPRKTPKDIIQSLKSQTDKVKKAAGGRIEAFTQRMNDSGAMNIDRTIESIDDVLSKLNKPGVIKDTGAISDLQTIRETLLEAPQSFEMLRQNRTAIRELVEGTDPLAKSQLFSRSKSLLKGVQKTITRQLDELVGEKEGAQALAKYKKADAVYANEARNLTKSRLKNVLDKGDITPENVENMLFSRKPTEIKLLHDSLGAEGKAAARSSIISRAIDSAGGAEDLSVAKFISALKKNDDSVQVFFKGDDKKRINGLKKLLDATRRAQDAAVVTPTGQSLQVLLAGGAGASAAGNVGVMATLGGAASAGAAARLYESKPVRDLLLVLANTPRGSTAFDQAVIKATPKISAVLQSIRKENEAKAK